MANRIQLSVLVSKSKDERTAFVRSFYNSAVLSGGKRGVRHADPRACLRNPIKYTDRIRSDLFSLPLEILFGRPRWLPGENKHFSGLFRRLHARPLRYSRSERRRARQIVGNGPSIHLPTIISNITHLFFPSAKLPFPLEINQSPPFHPVLSILSNTARFYIDDLRFTERERERERERKKNVSSPKSRNPVP